jgi:hypothetical protein
LVYDSECNTREKYAKDSAVSILMNPTVNKLYPILITACLIGYIWLGYSIYSSTLVANNSFVVCPVKHFTGFPCPSCGSTRSVVALINGNFKDALLINPIGYLIASIMLLTPLWILYDKMLGRESLLKCYIKAEKHIAKPSYLITLALIILINWFWNIKKGL